MSSWDFLFVHKIFNSTNNDLTFFLFGNSSISIPSKVKLDLTTSIILLSG